MDANLSPYVKYVASLIGVRLRQCIAAYWLNSCTLQSYTPGVVVVKTVG